ncbi:MAG: prolipoprotein diacylglyceryl transferase [Sphingomonadales bacterium]|nr:prolipoprotein diacylglyceryl transferase [Sphingomonadales bacterium]
MYETIAGALLAFPKIDPVAFAVGPVAVRWYSLAYIFGLILGWAYFVRLLRAPHPPCRRIDIDDFVMWAMIAIIVGGRLGYVLFYNREYYLSEPMAVLRLWDGGMSFHGGLLGMIIAVLWFTRRRHIPLLAFADRLACVAPIGLFLGRLANFINGELYGRATDVPWAMIFPADELGLPRHPSQLYEAALEGIVLFIVVNALFHKTRLATRPGILTGVFMIGYAVARMIVELAREPDSQIGFLAGGVTMGQLLSLPILIFGLALLWHGRRQPPAA